MADEDDLDANLPGLQAAEDLGKIWVDAWRQQRKNWMDAWKEIVNGSYTHQNLARDFARYYQVQYRAVERLFRYPVASTLHAEIPSWVNFDLRSERLDKITTSELRKTQRIRDFDPDDVKLKVTDLVPFGASTTRFTMTAEQVDFNRIKITVDSVVTADGETKLDGRGADYLTKARKDTREISGQYLGMVFELNPAQSAPPFAIVTLVI